MLRSYLACECDHSKHDHEGRTGPCSKCGCQRYKDHPLKPLELGSEPTPAAFVENMVRVFRLVRDCLAEHGTCWINVGDTYSGSSKGAGATKKQATNVGSFCGNGTKDGGVESGNLCLIPQRLAIALQDDGWLVRSVIVWHKPACMPANLFGWRWMRCRVKIGNKRSQDSSWSMDVKAESHRTHREVHWKDCPGCDRCTPNGGLVLRRGSWRPTSSWEPILMLAKGPGYFCDGEAVKQPAASATVSRNEYTRCLDDPDEQFAVKHDHEFEGGTANLRDVWRIAAESLSTVICEQCHWIGTVRQTPAEKKAKKRPRCPRCKGKISSHYAAFPTELVEWCLRAATSERGYCRTCGRPWVRVVEKVATGKKQKKGSNWATGDFSHGRESYVVEEDVTEAETIGWRLSCGCHAGLDVDDLEMISTPAGQRCGPDPSRETGRAGYNRPKDPGEGVAGMTRYEQRRYASQLRNSVHAAEMTAEAGGASTFAHYIREDSSGARPVPAEFLEKWIERGWLTRVTVPSGEPASPRPGLVLDPFSGSGRAGVAAQKLGLDYIGIELNPLYCEMSRKLLADGGAPLFAGVE